MHPVRMLALAACLLSIPKVYGHGASLLVHAEHELTPTLGLTGTFVPALNLAHELYPYAYVGLDWKPVPSFKLTPAVGWDFKADEFVVALRIAPKVGIWRAWANFEVQPQSWTTYWFAEVEYKALSWLEVGLEEESWGNFAKGESSFSHGGGGNVQLYFDHGRFDLALRARGAAGTEVQPDLFVRLHIFL